MRLFPNVANLPLRAPAMLAKQAASLDVLSGGRFEQGWARRVLGRHRSHGRPAAPAARRYRRWTKPCRSSARSGAVRGRSPYRANTTACGLQPGPMPAHPIEIWLGVIKPRAGADRPQRRRVGALALLRAAARFPRAPSASMRPRSRPAVTPPRSVACTTSTA
ncbi:MAG: LLM class flavin-dependent oxidoreductase [Anaerolineae bacterium]|nr:MAG: LLM class flavin-dependent oxidoreductase [Anaerolineae bacterium]